METNEINRAKYPKNTLKTLKQNTNGVYFIRSLLKKTGLSPKACLFLIPIRVGNKSEEEMFI